MPAQLQFLDMETTVSAPSGHNEPVPLTLGPNWQPNDIRMLLVAAGASSGDAIEDVAMTPDPPTGFTSPYSPAPGFGTEGVHYRTLVSGDADTSVSWPKPPGWRYFFWSLLTARGVDPATAPIAGRLSVTSTVGDGFATVSSVSVPAAGTMVFLLGTTNDLDGNWPSWPTAIGLPTGWSHLSATDKSGTGFYAYDTNPALLVVGKSFSGSGSTGTVTFPLGAGSPAFIGMWLFVRPAPDYSSTAGGATANATAGASTSSSTTNPVSVAGPATAKASAGQAFNGLTGYRVSDPLALSGNPVTASRVTWTLVPGAPGSTCTVETSINNGLTWDAAVNGAEVPRLRRGDTATPSVLTRVTMTRLSSSDTSPRLTSLEVQVSSDASTAEYVDVAYGLIDKVTVVVAGGNSTSASSGGGGPGVIGKGGGQAGGATSIKLHGVDLSKAVSRNVWTSPKVIPTGTNYGDAAKDIVLDRVPWLTQFNIGPTSRVTTEPLIYGLGSGTDPWQDGSEQCTAAGCEQFFGPEGMFNFRQVPDPSLGVPVWTIDDDAHPVITEISREFSDEQTFNWVTVKGEGTSSANPVAASAYDNDPTSQTYIYGAYGIKSVVVTLPNITTVAEAQTAANAILAGSLGGADTVHITMLCNPCLEPGDLVIVDVLDAKASGVYLISGIPSLPMSQASPMQLICFRQSRG